MIMLITFSHPHVFIIFAIIDTPSKEIPQYRVIATQLNAVLIVSKNLNIGKAQAMQSFISLR